MKQNDFSNRNQANSSTNTQNQTSTALVPYVSTRVLQNNTLNGNNTNTPQVDNANIGSNQSSVNQQNAGTLNTSTNRVNKISKRKRSPATNIRINSEQQNAIDFLTGNENKVERTPAKTRRHSNLSNESKTNQSTRQRTRTPRMTDQI